MKGQKRIEIDPNPVCTTCASSNAEGSNFCDCCGAELMPKSPSSMIQPCYVENPPPEIYSTLEDYQGLSSSLIDYYEGFDEPVEYYQERLLAEIRILQVRVNRLHNLIHDSYLWSPPKKGSGMHDNRLQWIAELEEKQALINLYFRLLRSQEFKAKL